MSKKTKKILLISFIVSIIMNIVCIISMANFMIHNQDDQEMILVPIEVLEM